MKLLGKLYLPRPVLDGFIALVLMMSATACTKELSNHTTILEIVTPDLQQYDDEFMLDARKAINEIEPGSPLDILMQDYLLLRDQIRVLNQDK